MQQLIFTRLPGRHLHHHLAVTRLGPGEVTLAHTHDYPEIFLVTGGRGVHGCNGRELPIGRGELAWVQPADRHYYRTGAGAGLELINLALAPAWWKNFSGLFQPRLAPRRAAGDPRHGHRRLAEAETAALEVILRTWLAEAADSNLWQTEVVARLLRTLVARPEVARGGVAPDWLAKWRADLATGENIGAPLSYWQKRCARSPEHLARTCRRVYGVVPTELISRARVAWVQERLRRGEDKVAALALEAGFQNLGYFYRTFRRIAGATPRTWRREQARDAAVPR
jgi:AraC family transcriptional regulator, dual regulator of chb operon